MKRERGREREKDTGMEGCVSRIMVKEIQPRHRSINQQCKDNKGGWMLSNASHLMNLVCAFTVCNCPRKTRFKDAI